jgi:cell division protein FtsB
MGIRILIPRPRLRKSRPTRKFVWAAFAVALWGTAYTFFGAGGLVGVYRAEAEIALLEDQVGEAEAVNADLARRIEALESDPEEIERVAREELYLVNPDDKVYLLEPEPLEGDETSPEDRPEAPNVEQR